MHAKGSKNPRDVEKKNMDSRLYTKTYNGLFRGNSKVKAEENLQNPVTKARVSKKPFRAGLSYLRQHHPLVVRLEHCLRLQGTLDIIWASKFLKDFC